MVWNDLALVAAGALGMLTAGVHGIAMQRHIVVPLKGLLKAGVELRGAGKRLVVPLLHVSTLAWFVGGALLIWAGLRAQHETQVIISATVGTLYLQAAVVNAWATRGRHPGWMVMAAAVALIVASLLGRAT